MLAARLHAVRKKTSGKMSLAKKSSDRKSLVNRTQPDRPSPR